tara:strand:- start:548 stop:943 length:396 start_codon:yes stop_codon:yes gene_type:complete
MLLGTESAWGLYSSQPKAGLATETEKIFLALEALAVVMPGLTAIITATTFGGLIGVLQRQMQRQSARTTANLEIQLTKWREAHTGPLPGAACVVLKTNTQSNQKEKGNFAVPFFISLLTHASRSGIQFVFH